MKSSNLFFTLFTLVFFLFTACESDAQNKQKTSTSRTQSSKIQLIQFHSEHRCMTCNKIETLTREAVKNNTNVTFSLLNVDDKKNEKMAQEFEAAGTALFLFNPATRKKKELTDFAFMTAGNKEKFIAELQKEIKNF